MSRLLMSTTEVDGCHIKNISIVLKVWFNNLQHITDIRLTVLLQYFFILYGTEFVLLYRPEENLDLYYFSSHKCVIVKIGDRIN